MSANQKYLNYIIAAIIKIKTIDKNKIQMTSYVGTDLGLDSIAVVDFWFELREDMKHNLEISAFFESVRSQSKKTNDFTVESIVQFLEKNIG